MGFQGKPAGNVRNVIERGGPAGKLLFLLPFVAAQFSPLKQQRPTDHIGTAKEKRGGPAGKL